MRDVLDKGPQERATIDIDILLAFIQKFQAFLKVSVQTRTELCKVMKIHILSQAHSIVRDDILLENWIVLINGQVQIQEIMPGEKPFDTPSDSDSISTCSGMSLPRSYSNGHNFRTLLSGDHFLPKTKKSMVNPTSPSSKGPPLTIYTHHYFLETLADDCQLLLVPLADYQRIITQQAQHLIRFEDPISGKLVLLKESKLLDQSGVACGDIVLRV